MKAKLKSNNKIILKEYLNYIMGNTVPKYEFVFLRKRLQFNIYCFYII